MEPEGSYLTNLERHKFKKNLADEWESVRD
jgi:hypothetical protein